MDTPDYKKINKASWNDVVEPHIASEFYDQQAFLDGKCTLPELDVKLLGDLKGKKVLHLQCHFGQDTYSIARRGATVTGVDFSDQAIAQARNLGKQLDIDVDFVCCDVYESPKHIDDTYDIVYTSYGVIGWLPDMDRWAEVVHGFLKPGGKLILVEFHPALWMYDDDFTKVTYSYFTADPIIDTSTSSYASGETDKEFKYVCWNHGMSEVIQPLLKRGMALKHMEEQDFSPYNCFANTYEFAPGKYRIKNFEDKMPMTYAIVVEKQ